VFADSLGTHRVRFDVRIVARQGANLDHNKDGPDETQESNLLAIQMPPELLKEHWRELNSYDLRLFLEDRIGGPGQVDREQGKPNTLYLPAARTACRIAVAFDSNGIISISPGQAFDPGEWQRVSDDLETLLLANTPKVGRDYSFSSFRVNGSWRGASSGLQILPPPSSAPRAPVEMADHPFILEFPIQGSEFWPVTNARRLRAQSRLTLLLNVLLAGRTSNLSRRADHFWALVRCNGQDKPEWVQQFFYAELGKAVTEELSPAADTQIDAVEPQEYYTRVGHDGLPLRVPSDLDDSIVCYQRLERKLRRRFDRATFWMDLASRQWSISISASFASLVSAIESLTERSKAHSFDCPVCAKRMNHEDPGPTRLFKDFLETHAPGATLAKQRDEMYTVRSGILHGSALMPIDQELAFGFSPLEWNQRELHDELWSVTRIALRNWLKATAAVTAQAPDGQAPTVA
jgi:hypothetical protein